MSSLKKIYSRNALALEVKKLKKQGKVIGVTNGVFDILHAGHISYLIAAKKACNILIVSLNTDASVRKYKGSGRPLINQNDRAAVVAALSCVDFVTFHNERHMQNTLLSLKPDLYIKGGDYTENALTSKNVLSKWGGKVKIIPLLPRHSTTNIINTVLHRYGDKTIGMDLKIPATKQKAVILDRDGVINEQIDYLHIPENLQFIPKAIEGMKKMQSMGFRIVIATNQTGIGLGYFTEEDFYLVNKKMLKELHKWKIDVDKIYFCPHSLADHCNCRKPNIGLLERAQEDLNLNPKKTWMIGDRSSDILAGKRMGFKTMLVTTGKGESYDTYNIQPDITVKNLVQAASKIKELS